MVSVTQPRVGHAGALLARFQTAKGTAVSDFTAAAALRLWTPNAQVGAEKDFENPTFMDSSYTGASSATWPRHDKPEGVVEVHATAAATEALLTSQYGTFAGGAFTYATQVSATRYMTLGWVEDRYVGTSSTQRMVRVVDTWFHTVEFIVRPYSGPVTIRGQYAARSSSNQALNAGGITLPAVPMRAGDTGVAGALSVTITRDPLGTPTALRFREARLTLAKPVAQPWDTANLAYDVFQRGKLHATLEFTSDWSDETWAIRDRSASNLSNTYRVVITFPASTFTATLYNVKMRTSQQGHSGYQYTPFVAAGEARTDGTNYVTLALA